jgi:hypothetical protein
MSGWNDGGQGWLTVLLHPRDVDDNSGRRAVLPARVRLDGHPVGPSRADPKSLVAGPNRMASHLRQTQRLYLELRA